MSFCKSVTKLTWRTLVFFFPPISQRGHANPFDRRYWLSGPRNNETLFNPDAKESGSTVCKPYAKINADKSCRDDAATALFLFLWRTFPDDDKLSCNSPNHTLSTHPGWYACNCRRRGLSYMFSSPGMQRPLLTHQPFLFPNSLQHAIKTTTKKLLWIIVIFLLY